MATVFRYLLAASIFVAGMLFVQTSRAFQNASDCSVTAEQSALKYSQPDETSGIVGGIPVGSRRPAIARFTDENGNVWYELAEGGWVINDFLSTSAGCEILPTPGPVIEPTKEPPLLPAPTQPATAPIPTIAPTATSDTTPVVPDEETLSRTVVRIITIQGGQPISSGTGTIVTPTGTIYTNRHVVEGGDIYEIQLLEDFNEPPISRYYASLQYYFAGMDFAVLQIDRNLSGSAILGTQLNLPYLNPETAEDAQRGDEVTIYGYPGIGSGYLVETHGRITTVQNDDICGQRMVASYQTDAEIAPGNSGGLAVNSQDKIVGIPTFVLSESTSGGRLGGILPFAAILAFSECNEPLTVWTITIPVQASAYLCEDPSASVEITLSIDELYLADPEEADTTSIIGGDEVIFLWGIGTLQPSNDIEYGANDAYLLIMSDDGQTGERFTNFSEIRRVVSCGEVVIIGIAAVEDEGFAGQNAIGNDFFEISLDAQAEYSSTGEIIERSLDFSGTTYDGSYRYEIRYTVILMPSE